MELVVEVLGHCDLGCSDDNGAEMLDDSALLQLKELFNYQVGKHLRVLLTGKTGTGKSTLVNGILGAEVAESSVGVVLGQGMTTGVLEYRQVVNGVELTVWDSPGLQDGTPSEAEYLELIAKQCGQRDIVLYCISMVHSRFVKGSMDIQAMIKLTEKFGEEFWSNCVLLPTLPPTSI